MLGYSKLGQKNTSMYLMYDGYTYCMPTHFLDEVFLKEEGTS